MLEFHRRAAHLFLSAATLTPFFSTATPSRADTVTQDQATRIVSKYSGVFRDPPPEQADALNNQAPLLGSGDLGVAIYGKIDAMSFVLGKNEFWSLKEGRVKAMARLNMSVSGMTGASYRMEQNLAKAEITGTFGLGQETVTTTSWVQATDTTNNPFYTILTNSGTQPKTVTLSFDGGKKGSKSLQTGDSGDVLYADVRADTDDTVEGYQTCKVRVAARVIGVPSTIASGTLTFTLKAGQSATVTTCTVSNYDRESYSSKAVDTLTTMTDADISSARSAHEAYWSNFYGRSFVEIPDKKLEAEWYGSLYLMASCSHPGEAPPGLFGNWNTDDPPWNGDYTLNYNYEAPFFLAMPTNHPELCDNYDKPLVDWLPKAEKLAAERGWTGAYYCVHIGPLPNGSSDKSEHNQKFIGAYAATPILMRYYYAKDLEYAKRVYPMLKQVAIFWQDYLFWDGNRYVIRDDAPQEDDPNPYVQSMLINGTANTRLWIPADLILQSPKTVLTFSLGPKPDTAWGSSKQDSPPSFDARKS